MSRCDGAGGDDKWQRQMTVIHFLKLAILFFIINQLFCVLVIPPLPCAFASWFDQAPHFPLFLFQLIP